MTKGDIVSGIGTDNAILDYQPASGVEACITSLPVTFTASWYNGQLASNMSSNSVNARFKMFVNNTVYLRISAAGAGKFGNYTGVQTK